MDTTRIYIYLFPIKLKRLIKRKLLIAGIFFGRAERSRPRLPREQFLLNNEDMVGWQEKVRQYPQNLMECFMTKNSSVGFNILILETRLNELRGDDTVAVQGNFEWVTPGDRSSHVEWVETPEGRFSNSYVLGEGLSNRKYLQNDVWYPSEPKKGCIGADAFKFVYCLCNRTEVRNSVAHCRCSRESGLL